MCFKSTMHYVQSGKLNYEAILRFCVVVIDIQVNELMVSLRSWKSRNDKSLNGTSGTLSTRVSEKAVALMAVFSGKVRQEFLEDEKVWLSSAIECIVEGWGCKEICTAYLRGLLKSTKQLTVVAKPCSSRKLFSYRWPWSLCEVWHKNMGTHMKLSVFQLSMKAIQET